MPDFKIILEQKVVDSNSVLNGDFTLELSGKVLDLSVECDDNSTDNTVVGWNEAPNKDILIPGKSKGYGVPEKGFLDGQTLYINFASIGAGPRALVTIWKRGEEIC